MIAGIDSQIGASVASELISKGWRVIGTSRRLEANKGKEVFYCDFSSKQSIDNCSAILINLKIEIDILVICVGVLNPIGSFEDLDPDVWEVGFYTNALGPIRFIRSLLSLMKSSKNAMVVTFAGGGINSAPTLYSSYTISKVALTKAMEIFAAENSNVRFVSLGTGWIKSPIHEQTLVAGPAAGDNRDELLRRIENNDFEDINKVAEFILWAFDSAGSQVSGRNFSLVHDPWGKSELLSKLKSRPDYFKLRRFGSD